MLKTLSSIFSHAFSKLVFRLNINYQLVKVSGVHFVCLFILIKINFNMRLRMIKSTNEICPAETHQPEHHQLGLVVP